MPPLRSFAAVDRFLAELGTPAMRPGYVLLGSESFLYDRARKGVLDRLVPPGLRDFCLHDLELSADLSLFDALDLAQTPSLMAPFQVLFLKGLKTLYGRGAKKEEFAALDRYFRSPNPQALLLFVADHLSLPADLRRMDREDKDRYDRIRETLGDTCGIVELQSIDEADAVRWATETAAARNTILQPDAARELVDALAGNMMQIGTEVEKLILYVANPARNESQKLNQPATSPHPGNHQAATSPDLTPHRPTNGIQHSRITPETITLADVETLVLAAKQRSLYELTDAISRRDRPRALLLLRGLLNSSDGEDSSIGQIYMLSRTFRQLLILQEKGVRDSRSMWTFLWPGFRMPPFAADELIAQARRYPSRSTLTHALRLIHRADLELRSSPPDKSLVLERLILNLTADPKPAALDLQPTDS